MKIIALTTPNCTKCKSVIPRVQELCDDNNVPVFIVDAMTEGRPYVMKHKIASVPSFLVLDDEDTVVSVLSGEDSYYDIRDMFN